MASAKLRRVMNRDRLEADIAAEAVKVFAECGYEGTSIAAIAENAGLSKQNLMYYYPSKQALYQRVLDDVLDDWLERMSHLADQDKEPVTTHIYRTRKAEHSTDSGFVYMLTQTKENEDYVLECKVTVSPPDAGGAKPVAP